MNIPNAHKFDKESFEFWLRKMNLVSALKFEMIDWPTYLELFREMECENETRQDSFSIKESDKFQPER